MKAYRKQVVPHLAGCGTRRAGYTYLVTDQKKVKQFPFSYFVYDPPVLVEDPAAWGLAAQGVSYVVKGGITHVLDWIGASYYPNAADILEEALGGYGSGLVPLSEKLGELAPGKSRRLLFHPKGWLHNPEPFKVNRVALAERDACLLPEGPMRDYHLEANDQMCAGLHWQDIQPQKGDPVYVDRMVLRHVGEKEYYGVEPPKDLAPKFDLALIAWLPIDEIHVVEGDDEKVKHALDILTRVSKLPIFVTNA